MYRRHNYRAGVIGLIVLGLLLPSGVSIAQDESTSPEDQTLDETLRLLQTDQSRSQLVDERAELQQAQMQLEQQRLELEKMRLDLEKQKEREWRDIQKAQEKLDRRQQQSERITRMFKIEHTDAQELGDVLRMFGGEIMSSSDPNVMVVVGSEETVAAVKAAIRILDVPSEPEAKPNIQLIVYTLEAVAPGGSPEFGEQAVPDDLESVVKELRNVFPYEDFRLVDTLLVRCRDGSHVETETYLPITTGEESTLGLQFRLNARTTVAADTHPAWIRIDGFTFSVSAESDPVSRPRMGPVRVRSQDRPLIALTSEIDMREGQKVVVGKGNAEMSSNALFAVVTAKVVD